MTTRHTLTALIVLLLAALPAALLAQDSTEEPPDCPAFADQTTEARIAYYMGEGIAYDRTGQPRAAEAAYTCIIEVIDGDYLPAYAGRVNIYTGGGRYEEAAADLNTVIALDASPYTTAAAYNSRGIIRVLVGEYELAADDFDEALGIVPAFVPAQNNRALVHVIDGEYEAALAIFDEILANSNVDAALTLIRDPENSADLPPYTTGEAQAYAMRALIRSAQALNDYDNYLTAARSNADGRLQSAAGALEARFTFELRIDDGSYFLRAPLIEPVPADEE